MNEYPASFVCPKCLGRAANLIYLPPAGIDIALTRRSFRTDDGRPGPSKRIVVCQHCHYGFTIEESHLVIHNRPT